MKLIPLSQTGKNKGKYFAQVDDEDYEWIIQWKWSVIKRKEEHKAMYASRCDYSFKPKKIIQMHRLIMGVSDFSIEPDHIDHNGLNNQRSNLRKSTDQQNSFNARKRSNTSSIYKGGCYLKKDKMWQGRITLNGKRYFLGVHKNEIDAAIAYDEKAKELFGEFACLNFK